MFFLPFHLLITYSSTCPVYLLSYSFYFGLHLCFSFLLTSFSYFFHLVVATCSGKLLAQNDNADRGVQFITLTGPTQSLPLAKDPNQFL